MKLSLAVMLMLSLVPAASGKTVWDTLVYTHGMHETKYKVGNCDVCHVNILKSKKARDDNYADDQSCAKSGCHDIKTQDSCYVCHTNSSAKSPKKPRREIKFSHKQHAALPPFPYAGTVPERGSAKTTSAKTGRKAAIAEADSKLMNIYELFSKGDTLGARELFSANRSLLKKYSSRDSYKSVQEMISWKSATKPATGNSGQPQKQSLGIDCRICHSYIDSTFYYTRKEMPLMAVCLDCHENERASINCSYCHTDPSIILSHSAGSRGDHGPLSAQSPRSCETCHDNNYCGKCHSGQIAEHVHPANYLYLHSYDAFSGSMQCETCHDTRQSCDGCHQRSWGRIVDHRNMISGTTSCKSCHRSK